MSFINSAALFLMVFPKPKTELTVFINTTVADYLRERRSIDEAASLLTHIENGGDFSCRSVRHDLFRPFSDRLIQHSIPYFCIAEDDNRVGFYYRSRDIDEVTLIAEQVLTEAAHYCQEVTGEELAFLHPNEMAIGFFFQEKETQVMFRHFLDRTFNGELIESVDLKDGSSLVTMLLQDYQNYPVRKALVRAYIASLGLMGDEQVSSVENEHHLISFLCSDGIERDAEGNRVCKAAWIVGKSDCCIFVDEQGMTYNAISFDKGGKAQYDVLFSCNRDSADFSNFLISYAKQIPYAAVTHSKQEAETHLKGLPEDTLDYAPSRDEMIVTLFEEELVDLIDSIVSRKIESDTVMKLEGHEIEKLEHYLTECAMLLDDALINLANLQDFMRAAPEEALKRKYIEPIVPEGYKLEDVDSIASLAAARGLSLEPYLPAIHALWNPEIGCGRLTGKEHDYDR